MPSLPRPIRRAVCAIAAALVFGGAGALIGSGSTAAHAMSTVQLKARISAGESQISSSTSALSAASEKLHELDSGIATLEQQIGNIQADLNSKRAEVFRVFGQLNATRGRLTALEASDAHAESVLAAQVVSSYESDRPDLVTVVLEATGFADLLERLSFAQRIKSQDLQVARQVEAARRAVAAEAIRLGALETRRSTLAAAVLQQRNRLARERVELIQQQLVAVQRRRHTTAQLERVQAQVAGLQTELATSEQAQASAGGQVPAAADSASVTFPLPRASASPAATWSLANGVDISGAADTPEYAICSGTIVLHGIGGFGPWAPVLHCDIPLDGHGYVYYGAAGPAGQLPVGTHVRSGQVISSIGSGLVGNSTGPHLELGFADSSGSPSSPQSAAAMLSLLQGAYKRGR